MAHILLKRGGFCLGEQVRPIEVDLLSVHLMILYLYTLEEDHPWTLTRNDTTVCVAEEMERVSLWQKSYSVYPTGGGVPQGLGGVTGLHQLGQNSQDAKHVAVKLGSLSKS